MKEHIKCNLKKVWKFAYVGVINKPEKDMGMNKRIYKEII